MWLSRVCNSSRSFSDQTYFARCDRNAEQLELQTTKKDIMAAPGGKFFIQEKLKEKAPHHESYQQLWETKWKKPVCLLLLCLPLFPSAFSSPSILPSLILRSSCFLSLPCALLRSHLHKH